MILQYEKEREWNHVIFKFLVFDTAWCHRCLVVNYKNLRYEEMRMLRRPEFVIVPCFIPKLYFCIAVSLSALYFLQECDCCHFWDLWEELKEMKQSGGDRLQWELRWFKTLPVSVRIIDTDPLLGAQTGRQSCCAGVVDIDLSYKLLRILLQLTRPWCESCVWVLVSYFWFLTLSVEVAVVMRALHWGKWEQFARFLWLQLFSVSFTASRPLFAILLLTFNFFIGILFLLTALETEKPGKGTGVELYCRSPGRMIHGQQFPLCCIQKLGAGKYILSQSQT